MLLNTQLPSETINKFFEGINYSKPLTDYAEVVNHTNLESFFMKAILLLIGFSICKVIIFYACNKSASKLKNANKSVHSMNYFEFKAYEKQLKKQGVLNEKRENLDGAKSNNEKVIPFSKITVQDEITKDLSNQAKSLFNVMLKNKQLKRDDILSIKDYLKKETKIKDSKKFNNDAHYIYHCFKHSLLKEETVREIISFLQSKAC